MIVADARRGFGNGFCIPAGPLREPVARGLARADLLLTLGDAMAQSVFDATTPDLPPLARARAQVQPLQMGLDWAGLRCLAFAGIAHPGAFFATLRGCGAELVQTVALSDHQPLTAALLARLDRDATRLRAQLVTTEKDAVRLPPAWRQKVLTLPVRLSWTDRAALDAALDGVLGPV